MIRRHFLKLPSLGAIGFLGAFPAAAAPAIKGSDREYSVALLTKIARPVLKAMKHR